MLKKIPTSRGTRAFSMLLAVCKHHKHPGAFAPAPRRHRADGNCIDDSLVRDAFVASRRFDSE